MHRRKYSRTIAIAVALVAGAVGAASGVGAVAATSGAGAVQALAGSTTTTGLVVSVAYAENVGDTGAVPIWFPTPWCTLVSATSTTCSGGANPSNVRFLGQPDPNTQECAPTSKNPSLSKPYCWDEGAVRLDNPTSSSIIVSGIGVNVHCSTSSGKLYYGGTISTAGFNCLSGQTRQLWGAAGCSGCFFPLTIQPGKSVILTGNPPPPAHQDTFVDFDSSDTPHMNTGSCPPSATPPTVTIASSPQGGATVTDMLTDSAHVLDTGWWINGTFGGVDSGWCPRHQNESVQWEQIGWPQRSAAACDSSGTPCGLAAALNLSPATQTLLVIQPATVTATLIGGDKVALANAPVNFKVTSGPNAGQSNGPVYTDSSGQASWTYNDTTGINSNGADTVVATAGFIGPFSSNSVCVAWGTGTCGSPPPNDFSISASPNTVTVAPGGSGSTTINTATTSGSSQSVALTASGLPSGAGASFSPSSVTSGGSSLMTITTMTSTPTGSSTVTVTGTGTSATHSTTVTLVVQSSPPPPPGCPALWTCADIGSPTPAGSESVTAGGAWTINAGGSDIFSSADHFRFDYQSPGGTTNTVEAQITGQTNSNTWAKAGVMMRLDNTVGSPQFSVLITPGNGVFVEYRSTAGGTTTRAGTVVGQLPPKYIWVVRSGTTFTGWYSTTNNLAAATKLFSQTIAAMSGTVLEGLAATSHNTSALCTVTMDTVSVS